MSALTAYQADLIPEPTTSTPLLALRPYQEDALAAVDEGLGRGINRPLIALPTGGGKTVVFAHLAARRGGRTLVLAHRDELIRQAATKLRQVNPRAGIGIVQADQDQTAAPVVVASIQTLARVNRLHRLPRQWQTVIIDEAHHATAGSYRRVLEHVGAFDSLGTLAVGVTATPERADGQALGDVWQEIVYQRSILDMILEGYLVDLRAMQIKLAADFGQLHVRAGDYVDREVEETLLKANAPDHVVRAYLEHARDRKTLLFTPTVKVAHLMAARFTESGIEAAAIDGATPHEERREILDRFHRGEIRVLANCAVLTEGYDEPSVECVIIARPTKSRPLYVQMIGRGTRLHPGKDDCLIIDLVGASTQHDLVTVASLFNLTPEELNGQTVTSAKRKRQRAARPDANDTPDGRLVAADVDLFRRSSLHWIQLGADEFILPVGGDTLWLVNRNEGWDVVQRNPKTRGTTGIATGLSLEYAQGVAEDVARQADVPRAFTDPRASWRSQPASENQLQKLTKWGVPFAPDITKGEASDLMTITIAKWKRR